MKTSFRHNILGLVVLGFVCAPLIGREPENTSKEVYVSGGAIAQGVSPETMAERLDQAVALTAVQKAEVIEILRQQAESLQALPGTNPSDIGKEWERLKAIMKIKTAARAQVRALLTAEQQMKYDRTPQIRGGGQTMNVANRVARLDAEVVLTAEQKKLATEVYAEEVEELLMFPPEDRPAKGRAARQASKELIRAMLTPEQREKLDSTQRAAAAKSAEEKAFVEHFLRSSNVVSMRVGSVTALTSPSSSVEELNGQFREGKYTYLVTGSVRSETLTVYWERTLPEAQLKVVKIEDSTGQPIQL